MRAHKALEATVAIYPTLVLTNALPYDMDIVVWQVGPLHIGVLATISQSVTAAGRFTKVDVKKWASRRTMVTDLTDQQAVLHDRSTYTTLLQWCRASFQ